MPDTSNRKSEYVLIEKICEDVRGLRTEIAKLWELLGLYFPTYPPPKAALELPFQDKLPRLKEVILRGVAA